MGVAGRGAEVAEVAAEAGDGKLVGQGGGLLRLGGFHAVRQRLPDLCGS